MNIVIGGSGFVGSRLKTVLFDSVILDKALKRGEGYVDITKA